MTDWLSDLLYYVAIAGIMVAAFLFLKKRRRTTAARQTPALRADAERLGWTFEADQTLIFEIFRWRGTTDGVPWVAEALRTGRDPHHPRRSFTTITRWYTTQSVPTPAAFAILRADADDPFKRTPDLALLSDAQGLGGVGSHLAAAATGTAFNIRFGEEVGGSVDSGALTAASGIDRDLPNAALLTAEAQRRAVVELIASRKDALTFTVGDQPVSVLVTPGGVAVSVARWTATAEDLRPLVIGAVNLVRTLQS